MAKSRYHKKSRSNRRKTQRRRIQRGGWEWPNFLKNLVGSQDTNTALKRQDGQLNLLADEKQADETPLKRQDGQLNLLADETPLKIQDGQSNLLSGGRKYHRKSSRRSNLKRKL